MPPEADPALPVRLVPALSAEPWTYDFFRAVRLLECARPDLPRVGESLHPRQDPVRFGQKPSLAFAPATLAGTEPAIPDLARPERWLIHFMGMFGPNGALPLHLTERASQRGQHARIMGNPYHTHDVTLARFLDVFHHRIISLFYRAWADAQKSVDFDRPDEARFGVYLASFFGMGMKSLRDRDEAPDWTKIFFSGRLASQPRNPEGLAAILEGDLGIAVRVMTFMGQWLDLPAESQCRLGASRESGTLGSTAIVGRRFWAGHLKFRLRFGPLGWADYQRLLPLAGERGRAWRRVRSWVRNYVGYELGWEAQLVLRAAEVPSIQLGRLGMLGWSTWLKSRPTPEDADQLVLQGEAV